MVSMEYATALYELTIGKIDEFKGEFDDFMEIISTNSDFLKFLVSPAIKKEKKKQVIENTLNEFDGLFLTFCMVLIDNGRFGIIEDIYRDFNLLVGDGKGIFVVNAYTSKPLTEKEKEELISSLLDKFKGKIKINYIVDSSALGGIRLEHNGESIDQTFKTQMHNLKAFL